MKNPDIIRELKNILKNVAPTASAILFGSRARGDNREDSDVDLLILIDKDNMKYEDESRITDPLYDFEFNNGVIMSPIVMTRQAWEETKYRTTLYDEVARDGIRLL